MIKNTIIAVLLAGLIAISGLININFQHNLHLPKEITNRTSIIKPNAVQRILFGAPTVIYLADSLKTDYQFREVIETLNQATRFDNIVFHIAGEGGAVDVTLNLISNIQNTKAHTTMIVDAPSYSGHAFIALSGDELVMSPYSYLMLHTSSAMNVDCNQFLGKDRRMTETEVCEVMLKAHLSNLTSFILGIKYITNQQKMDTIFGKTITIKEEDLKRNQPTTNEPASTGVLLNEELLKKSMPGNSLGLDMQYFTNFQILNN